MRKADLEDVWRGNKKKYKKLQTTPIGKRKKFSAATIDGFTA
jgi:hypothetical protein